MPGVVVERRLVTPDLPASWTAPDVVVLRSDRDGRTGCVEIGLDVRCVEGRVHPSEEPRTMDRSVAMAASATYEPDLLVRPRAGRALDRLIQTGQPLRISASSEAVPDPRGGAVAAIDGDPGTSWLARSDDLQPTLSLRWIGEKQIDGVSLSLDEQTAARLPTRVRLTWPEGVLEVDLEDGRAEFEPIVTDQLQLSVVRGDDTVDLGFDAQSSDVGIGVGEIELDGLTYLPLVLSADARSTACGVGPDVALGGATYPTFVDYSPEQLFRGALAQARLCVPGSGRIPVADESVASLAAGENDVTVGGSRAFDASSLVLRRVAGGRTATWTAPAEESGDAVRRTIRPSADATLVELRQNANAGWVATQDGRRLEPVVLDGWKQGWLLRGNGPVAAEYEPDRTYRIGLGSGLLLLVLLLVALAVPRRTSAAPPGLHGRTVPRWLATPLLAVAAGLTAGWVGVVVAAATVILCAVGGRRWGPPWAEGAPWLFGGSAFVVSLWYAVRPWGDPTGWAGEAAWTAYLLVVPLAAMVWLAAGPGRLQIPFRRSAGRSKSR